MFSESKVIEKYLYEIVHSTRLDPFLKLISARHLKEYSKKGYDCFDYLCTVKDDNFPIVSKIECMCTLLEDDEFKEKGLGYLNSFFNDQEIDCFYRYKTIIGIHEKLGNAITVLLKNFIVNPRNLITYKILACQFILTKYKEDLDLRVMCQDTLLRFLDMHDIAYNVRADACDVLLQYGDDHAKSLATLVLDNLARDGGGEMRTIYQNAQNVHTKAIEESASKILGELSKEVTGMITFETALDEFKDFLDDNFGDEVREKVYSSLNRITVDRAVYGSVSMTLTTIFIKLWLYIKQHPESTLLKHRFVDELSDTTGLCSSGYVTRMVNTLSGITEMSLSISYEDQVCANLDARLNSKIMKLDNEELISLILEEMAIPSQYYHERPHFLKFFRENISFIREELYQEFQGLISDIDFDFYIRRSIMKYQGDDMI
jgi:hypothetical protein